MKYRNLLAPFVICLALSACSSPPVRMDPSYLPPPSQKPDYPDGKIGVSLAYTTQDGEDLDLYDGEASNFASGMQAYINQHLSDWQITGADQATTITLDCDQTQIGGSSCSDFRYVCAIQLGEENRLFEKMLPSDTCMQGGVAASYRTQAYNHGQQIGQSVLENIATLPGLKETVAEEALDKALNYSGTSSLERIVSQFSGTTAAEQAQQELDIRRVAQQREAEERAARIAARTAEANQQLEALKTSGDPDALDTFAREYSDIGEASKQAAALAAALRGEDLTPEEPVQANTLSCFDRRNNLCGDYSFPTAEQRNEFAAKCQSMGSELLPAQCDASGAIGCFMRSGATTTTTWAYQIDKSQFAMSCRGNGGQVID